MSHQDTLGVVIPTLNCAHMLPEHLTSMDSWLDLVEQIVVVDSHSQDGTWEILQQKLKSHPKASFHQRPRGLYESWNYGIAQLKSEFTYISTVGDSITKQGLAHLCEVAGLVEADVVVSEPVFLTENGEIQKNQEAWPISKMLQKMKIKEPRLLSSNVLSCFILENPQDAILGSSASNIYRTKILQERPFPTEFGTTGDAAWGIKNLNFYRLAVTPMRFSTFRNHEKSYDISKYKINNLNWILISELDKVYDSLRSNKNVDSSFFKKKENLIKIAKNKMYYQNLLASSRCRKLHWVVHPAAWYYRFRRNYFKSIFEKKLNYKIINDFTDR